MARAFSNPLTIDLAAHIESGDTTIDLRTTEFERTSSQFLKAVKNYTARAREEIVQRKQRHGAEVKRVQERLTQADGEIRECKVKEIELMQGA
jgi:kinetochore protein Spc25, fungi type